MSHPLHPTRNDWHPECDECHLMFCPDCFHPRIEHSHQQGCLFAACVCPNKKYYAVFMDWYALPIPVQNSLRRYGWLA